jgi:hypothetical protein
MILFIWQKWLRVSAIFMSMENREKGAATNDRPDAAIFADGNVPVSGHWPKILRFLLFSDAQPGAVVDLLLKKSALIRFKI